MSISLPIQAHSFPTTQKMISSSAEFRNARENTGCTIQTHSVLFPLSILVTTSFSLKGVRGYNRRHPICEANHSSTPVSSAKYTGVNIGDRHESKALRTDCAFYSRTKWNSHSKPFLHFHCSSYDFCQWLY